MREHADKMTADVHRLSEQLTKALEEQKRLQQTMKEEQERALADVAVNLENVFSSTFREQLTLLWSAVEHKNKGLE